MAKTTVYRVGGEEVNSIKEVASILGFKVSKKDILAGAVEGVEAIEPYDIDMQHKDEFARLEYDQEQKALASKFDDTVAIVAQDADEISVPEDTPNQSDEGDVGENLSEPSNEENGVGDDNSESTSEDGDDSSDPVDEDGTGEDDIEYPEVGTFKDEKAMKKFIKKLSDGQLQEWCELEGATWKPCDHESINRMRMAMSIKALHFPSTAPQAGKSTKKKSKYADFTTEQLVQMAMDNEVDVKDAKGDMRILRMYTIMALKGAGLLA